MMHPVSTSGFSDRESPIGPEPGFWVGASGVAARWYGETQALVEYLVDTLSVTSSELLLAEAGHAVAHEMRPGGGLHPSAKLR
jgi:hypothetical protein